MEGKVERKRREGKARQGKTGVSGRGLPGAELPRPPGLAGAQGCRPQVSAQGFVLAGSGLRGGQAGSRQGGTLGRARSAQFEVHGSPGARKGRSRRLEWDLLPAEGALHRHL